MNDRKIEEILDFFGIKGRVKGWNRYGSGKINQTFLITMEGKKSLSYILQRISNNAFYEVQENMRNIHNVTEFVARHLQNDEKLLQLISNHAGNHLFEDEEGASYRMYSYIKNSKSYDVVVDEHHVYECGRLLGQFERILVGFDKTQIVGTRMLSFHHSMNYYEALESALTNGQEHDKLEREFVKELFFIRNHLEWIQRIERKKANGELPIRVVHNDTKLSNYLFDCTTGRGLTLVDLDTISLGSVVTDFGDALRSIGMSCHEEELERYFLSFTKGYLSEMGTVLTKHEGESLYDGILAMVMECGIRYLLDYVSKSNYFYNLSHEEKKVRAKKHFELAQVIAEKETTLRPMLTQMLNGVNISK